MPGQLRLCNFLVPQQQNPPLSNISMRTLLPNNNLMHIVPPPPNPIANPPTLVPPHKWFILNFP